MVDWEWDSLCITTVTVTYIRKAVLSLQLPIWLAVDSRQLGSTWLQLLTTSQLCVARPIYTAVWRPCSGQLWCLDAGLETMAIICNTNVSYACLSLHYLGHGVLYYIGVPGCLGMYQSVESLSASDVEIDDGCSPHYIHSYGLKPFLSFNCKYCTGRLPFTMVCLRS